MNADGTGVRKLTDDPANDPSPAWSPDGRTIAFVSDRDGATGIFVMSADGSGQKALTQRREGRAPVWSPDGRRLAFVRVAGGKAAIYVMNADGSGQRQVIQDPNDWISGLSWSPDGRRLAFSSGRDQVAGELYLVNADGTKLVRLTTNRFGDNGPVWSPADEAFPSLAAAVVALLCLTAGASATPPGQNGKLAFRRWLDPAHTWAAIFTADADGSGVRAAHPPAEARRRRRARLVARRHADPVPADRPRRLREPLRDRRARRRLERRLAPDEARVRPAGEGMRQAAAARPAGSAARCRSGRRTASGSRTSARCSRRRATRATAASASMNADGSDVRELPQDPPTGLSDAQPAWSPDGKRIAFGRGVRDERAVFVMDADGSDARQVTPWALRGGQPDWSPDGKLLVLYSNRDGPTDVSANVYTVAPDGTGLKQLTHARGGGVQYLSASFSPDGKWIAVGRTPGVGSAGNADVFVMRVDGSAMRNATRSAIWDSGVDWGPRP